MKYIASLCVIILIALNFENVAGVPPEYTPKEKAALEKFRELVKDVTYKEYMKSDHYLIRWLRAKDFNLDEASQHLRTAMAWRKENKIDGILKETILEFPKTPFYMDGADREGSIVFVLMASRLDMRKYLLNGKRNEAIRYWHKLLEMREIKSLELLGVIGNASEPERKRADKITSIIDLDRYNIREHGCLACLGVYVQWLRDIEAYYPNYAKHFIMINASRVAIPLIELLKPIMSPATSKIFQVFGKNKEEWTPVLHKIISPDQIRSNLGGTKPE